MSKVFRQVLDSDIAATQLNLVAVTCIFGNEITSLRVVRAYEFTQVFRFLSFVTFFLISVALDKIGSDLPPPILHRGFERDPTSWSGARRVHTIPQGLKSEI